MEIVISNSSGRPIYEQIADQVKSQIVSGQLKAGDPLPSMRQLAQSLRISVITTKRAYNDLEAEGFIETVAGKGCYVSAQDPESSPGGESQAGRGAHPQSGGRCPQPRDNQG